MPRPRATPPPFKRPDGDPLASLGDRGWTDLREGGWRHPELGITVRPVASGNYVVEHDDHTRIATSATGALCIADAIERKAAAK